MDQKLLMIAVAAAAAYFIASKTASTKTPTAKTNTRTPVDPRATGGTLVSEWNGWKYYSDGTAIDPFGAYYLRGVKVWDPIMGAVQ